MYPYFWHLLHRPFLLFLLTARLTVLNCPLRRFSSSLLRGTARYSFPMALPSSSLLRKHRNGTSGNMRTYSQIFLCYRRRPPPATTKVCPSLFHSFSVANSPLATFPCFHRKSDQEAAFLLFKRIHLLFQIFVDLLRNLHAQERSRPLIPGLHHQAFRLFA